MLMRNDSVQSDQLDEVGEVALAGVLLLGRSQRMGGVESPQALEKREGRVGIVGSGGHFLLSSQ